jgi:hypothetical protein
MAIIIGSRILIILITSMKPNAKYKEQKVEYHHYISIENQETSDIFDSPAE